MWGACRQRTFSVYNLISNISKTSARFSSGFQTREKFETTRPQDGFLNMTETIWKICHLYNNQINAPLWLVNQLWVIVPINPRKNRASSELLYKSNRPRVSVVYKLINHLGCWYNTRRICKPLACGSWFTNSSRVLPTSRVVYQLINHRNV